MLFNPAFRFLVVGAQGSNQAPEPDGMVHFPRMRQFMQDDIVADSRRRLHQAPVQDPQRDRWLRTVTRRTANPCAAASSSVRRGSSREASRRRCP